MGFLKSPSVVELRLFLFPSLIGLRVSRDHRHPIPPAPILTGYTQDALHEIDAFFRKSGKAIVALTVKDILEEQIAHKLA